MDEERLPGPDMVSGFSLMIGPSSSLADEEKSCEECPVYGGNSLSIFVPADFDEQARMYGIGIPSIAAAAGMSASDFRGLCGKIMLCAAASAIGEDFEYVMLDSMARHSPAPLINLVSQYNDAKRTVETVDGIDAFIAMFRRVVLFLQMACPAAYVVRVEPVEGKHPITIGGAVRI